MPSSSDNLLWDPEDRPDWVPELVAAARSSLLDSFSDFRCRIEFGSGQSWHGASADLERRVVASQAPVEKPTDTLDRYAHLRGAGPYIPTEADARAEAMARKIQKQA